MKKSLIALAALAASGFAMAQSSVTLFGVVDTGVAYVKGNDNSWTGLQNNGNATSRLGFRGTEDLGGGLKANFWLEGAIDPDTGGSALNFQRRSTVGVSGNFGELRLGRELTAAYNAVSRYDVFGDVGFGATRMFNNDTVSDSHNNRRSNMVTYLSNDLSGFRVNVNYAFGESVEDSAGDTFERGAYYGAGLTYDNGPLSLGLGIERQNNPALVNGVAPVAGGDDRLTSYALGGAYDFGAVKLNAAYRLAKNKPLVGETLDNKAYMIGLSVPVGSAGVVKASYNRYDLEGGVVAREGKADQFALGYVHSVSKRTAVYGTYAYLKNKGDAAVSLNGQAAATQGDKNHAIQVGVRHAF